MNWTNTAEEKILESLEYQRTYTVEEDGKKQLLKLAGELNISLQEKDIQRVHRLGKKERSKAAKLRGIIVTFCFVC